MYIFNVPTFAAVLIMDILYAPTSAAFSRSVFVLVQRRQISFHRRKDINLIFDIRVSCLLQWHITGVEYLPESSYNTYAIDE